MNLQIQLLAVLVAVACALPGVFLVLRRMALISDAISHVVLLGIVVSFLIVRDLDSPWLFLGAAASGVVAVALVELIQRTGRVREDAAIGLVFPAMFSVAVILVALYTRNTHLDVDAVFKGDFIWSAEGWESTVRVAIVLVLNVVFIAIFYKELKLATFDPALATAMGLLPGVLHYVLMGLVSLTAVVAFDAVGSVLVVALMIVPAATAYLLTDRLAVLIALSGLLAIVGALGGFWLAKWAQDVNIAGSMAVVLGMEFALAFLLAPRRGLLARWRQRRQQYANFLRTMLAIHLLNHEGTPAEAVESRVSGLHEHLRWPRELVQHVVRQARQAGLVEQRGEWLALTDAGRTLARQIYTGNRP